MENRLMLETIGDRAMSTSDSKREEGRTTNSKLSRLLDMYDLDDLGERIEDYWLDDTDNRYSLRELAEYINQQLLRTVMREAGMDPLKGEVENIYRLLTDDDISTGTYTQACRRLERAGVDVDQLDADFVSRQAVHTYLTSVRGVTYSTEDSDPVKDEATNVRRLQRRMTTMTTGKLSRLQNAGHITLGEFELLLDMRVLCKDCGTQYQVSDLLEKRTCECAPDPN